MNKPNVRERRFVDAYLGSAKANSTEAVISAGLTKNRNSARVIGTRLLASVNVQAALPARLAKETAASILSARERDEMLSHFARTSGDIHARMRATAELNKCSGRHAVKHSTRADSRSNKSSGSRGSERPGGAKQCEARDLEYKSEHMARLRPVRSRCAASAPTPR